MESEPPPPEPLRLTRSAALSLLAAVAVFLWAPFLLGGDVLLLRDVLFDSLPWRRFAEESIGAGHVPLWNPYSRFGQPFVANPQSAVFYPPHLLFNVASPIVALQLVLCFHLLVAALSTFALARFWRLDRGPAALAAVTYAFGGYMTANLEFMSVFETLAWCPLTLLLTAHLVRRRRMKTVLALAVVVALQILPGNPQPAGFTVLLCGMYAVATAIQDRDWRAFGAVAACVAAALVLAVGLCMLQIAPTLELLPLSVRAAGIDTGMDIASMPPRHLLTLLLPFAYGEPLHERWFGQPLFEFWLGSVHVGIVPLVLASFGLLLRQGDRLRALAGFALVVVAFGVVIALGDHTFVYPLLTKLPGFDRVRWPAKALQFVALILPLLAAIGMQALWTWRREPPEGARFTPARILIGWGAVGVALFFIAPVDGVSTTSDAAIAALFLALTAAAVLAPPRLRQCGGVALVVLAFANLLVQSGRIHPTGTPDAYTHVPRDIASYREQAQTRVFTNYSHAQYALYGRSDAGAIRTAVDAMTGESSLPFHVFKTYGGDALQVSSTKEITDLLESPELPDAGAARLASVLGVGFALSGPPFEQLTAARTPNANALRWDPLPGPLPRAYCVDGFVVEGDRTRATAALISPEFNPRLTAIIDPSTPAFAHQPIVPVRLSLAVPPGTVRDVRYDWNRVAIDVDVQRECMLVLTDTWFPGWTAHAGGDPLPIHRINVIFRGVKLSKGTHTVEYRYAPESFRIGRAISATTALLMLLLAMVRVRLTGRVRTGDDPPAAS